MKALVGIIIIGLIAVGIYFYTSQKGTSETATTVTPTQSTADAVIPTNTKNDDLKQGGSSYRDPNDVYVFLYPNDYVLDTNDAAHIRIYKTGATQKGQTEMYDGVLMVFETVDLNGQSLSDFIDNRINTSIENGTGEVLEPKKSIMLNSYPGFTYTIRGLGESKYIVIQKDLNASNAVIIAMAVNDPENKNYQAEVDKILSTLEVLK